MGSTWASSASKGDIVYVSRPTVAGAEFTPRLQTTLLLGLVPQTLIGSPTENDEVPCRDLSGCFHGYERPLRGAVTDCNGSTADQAPWLPHCSS
jgi:hypothetical protein